MYRTVYSLYQDNWNLLISIRNFESFLNAQNILSIWPSKLANLPFLNYFHDFTHLKSIRSRCLNCHGDGWMHDSSGHRERCFYCQHSKHGHGQQDCSKCGSKGRVNCTTCEGQGQIRCYIQLSITWKTNTAEHIIERLGLPSDLIRDVSGQVAYEEEGARVKPIGVFSEDLGIKDASTRLVFNHLNSFADHKVIRQRHQVIYGLTSR